MIALSVKRNSNYKELEVNGADSSFSTGLLDEAESIDVAKQLISAAEDLLPSGYDDEDRELQAVRNRI